MTVVGRDLDLVDVIHIGVVRILVIRCNLEGQHAGGGVDRELGIVRSAGDLVRKRLGGQVLVRGRHRQGGRLVLWNAGSRQRHDKRRIVDVGDGDRDVLAVCPAMTVVGRDVHLVDVVRVGVGGVLEVRPRPEGQLARHGVDREPGIVRSAGDLVGDHLGGQVLIGGRHRQGGRLVLGSAGRRERRDHRRPVVATPVAEVDVRHALARLDGHTVRAQYERGRHCRESALAGPTHDGDGTPLHWAKIAGIEAGKVLGQIKLTRHAVAHCVEDLQLACEVHSAQPEDRSTTIIDPRDPYAHDDRFRLRSGQDYVGDVVPVGQHSHQAGFPVILEDWVRGRGQGREGLHVAGGYQFGHHIRAGQDVHKRVPAVGVRDGLGLADVLPAVLVQVEIDRHACHAALAGVPHAVAIQILPRGPGDPAVIVVDICDGDRDVLAVCPAATVVGDDLDLIDVIHIGVGRILEVRRHLESQHAGDGVDREHGIVHSAGDLVRDRLGRQVLIDGRHRQGERLALGNVGLRQRRDHRRPVVGIPVAEVDVRHALARLEGHAVRAQCNRGRHCRESTLAGFTHDRDRTPLR